MLPVCQRPQHRRSSASAFNNTCPEEWHRTALEWKPPASQVKVAHPCLLLQEVNDDQCHGYCQWHNCTVYWPRILDYGCSKVNEEREDNSLMYDGCVVLSRELTDDLNVSARSPQADIT
jgi:hypothetical protein